MANTSMGINTARLLSNIVSGKQNSPTTNSAQTTTTNPTETTKSYGIMAFNIQEVMKL